MKKIAVIISDIIGTLTCAFYKLRCRISIISELLYGQKLKHSLSKPLPNLMFAVKPVKLIGQGYIEIGEQVKIGQYSTVSAWVFNKELSSPVIKISDNVVIGSFNHITACNSIVIEEGVLLGKYVTITDNSHGIIDHSEVDIPPIKRQLYSKGGVFIHKNVWIGDKVTVLPNVTIGEGAIIGANSVVTKDVPPYTVVCGNPAKVVKNI